MKVTDVNKGETSDDTVHKWSHRTRQHSSRCGKESLARSQEAAGFGRLLRSMQLLFWLTVVGSTPHKVVHAQVCDANAPPLFL